MLLCPPIRKFFKGGESNYLMRKLTDEERVFLKGLLKYSAKNQNGYLVYNPNNKTYGNKKYKRSRVNFMIQKGVWLEKYEIIHHKDGNKQNDALENLEMIDTFDFNYHTSRHSIGLKKPNSGNHKSKTKEEVIERAKGIASEMVKINYSEISRRLKREGIKINSYTLSKYLKPKISK